MTPEQVQERVSRAARAAVKAWGPESQVRMAQEEAAELIAALNQFSRGRLPIEAVADEVADVIIMCAQLRVMLGGERVDAAVLRKLERLEGRIREGGHEL